MNSAPTTFLERLDAVRAAGGALDGFGALAGQVPAADLGAVIGHLAEVGAKITAQIAVLVAAAEEAGEVERSQYATTRAYVADHAWHARSQAGTLAKAATVLRRPDLKPVAAAVLDLDITPHMAVTIADTYDKTRGALVDGCDQEVLDWFIAIGAEEGTSAVRNLREHVIAKFGRSGSLQEQQDRCRRQISLSPGRMTADGVHQYELVLDAEGRAQLEAAIGPGSAPSPGPDGQQDLRPIGRRRGEALVDALHRSVSVIASGRPGGAKSTLFLTMDAQNLIDRVGAATVLGTRAQETLLAPDTVRRLACDAEIIPAVLGSEGQILDLGRLVRLFDSAQNKALLFRDRHCTFPGCSAPAAWCDAHHLIHWLDGGLTDFDNAALLCKRHHTIVHRDQLAGKVVLGRVVWDRQPGSYHRLLTEVRRT